MWVFFLLVIWSIGATYYRIMIKRDYIIEAQTDCDPAVDKCFVHHCDATSEECTGDKTQDTSYYKISRRNAGLIPLCDPSDENCQPFICGENEKDCSETFCDTQRIPKDNLDKCNDPVQYLIDNPPVEEDAAAGEDSATCDPAQDSTCEDSANVDATGGGGNGSDVENSADL